MSAPALATEGLGLVIGGAVIVEDLSLSVAPGEMLGVIGPNGAGKTTLFNLLSGLRAPTSGAVRLAGIDVTSRPAHRRARLGLGRTFQTSSVFAGLSVLENVRLAAQAHLGGSLSVLRCPQRADTSNRIAEERLAEVGLESRARTLAGELSHGEKRKLELAGLLAADPSVILLDEPMAGVGMADVAGLCELITRIHREHGRTVLLIEHHMDVVLGLVDRVAVMHRGRLLACDTPAAIKTDPAVQSAYLGVGT